jgi:hypothetical protein
MNVDASHFSSIYKWHPCIEISWFSFAFLLCFITSSYWSCFNSPLESSNWMDCTKICGGLMLLTMDESPMQWLLVKWVFEICVKFWHLHNGLPPQNILSSTKAWSHIIGQLKCVWLWWWRKIMKNMLMTKAYNP